MCALAMPFNHSRLPADSMWQGITLLQIKTAAGWDQPPYLELFRCMKQLHTSMGRWGETCTGILANTCNSYVADRCDILSQSSGGLIGYRAGEDRKLTVPVSVRQILCRGYGHRSLPYHALRFRVRGATADYDCGDDAGVRYRSFSYRWYLPDPLNQIQSMAITIARMPI